MIILNLGRFLKRLLKHDHEIQIEYECVSNVKVPHSG